MSDFPRLVEWALVAVLSGLTVVVSAIAIGIATLPFRVRARWGEPNRSRRG